MHLFCQVMVNPRKSHVWSLKPVARLHYWVATCMLTDQPQVLDTSQWGSAEGCPICEVDGLAMASPQSGSSYWRITFPGSISAAQRKWSCRSLRTSAKLLDVTGQDAKRNMATCSDGWVTCSPLLASPMLNHRNGDRERERVMELGGQAPNVWKHVNLVGYYRSWRCVLRGSLAKSRHNLSGCILSKTFGHLPNLRLWITSMIHNFRTGQLLYPTFTDHCCSMWDVRCSPIFSSAYHVRWCTKRVSTFPRLHARLGPHVPSFRRQLVLQTAVADPAGLRDSESSSWSIFSSKRQLT